MGQEIENYETTQSAPVPGHAGRHVGHGSQQRIFGDQDGGARVSAAPHHADRAMAGGGLHRHLDAHPGGAGIQTPEAAPGSRKPARCRWDHGHATVADGQARWLHHCPVAAARVPHRPHAESAVGPDPRHHAHSANFGLHLWHHRADGEPVPLRGRHTALGACASWRTHRRLQRHGDHTPHRHGRADGPTGHHLCARAL